MISTGLSSVSKFYECCLSWYTSHGHPKREVVSYIARTLLILVKITARHTVASLLMRSSVKMEVSHLAAI